MIARRRTGESGYAMLLVFLIAAMIAIALYREMPRVAFEAQRDREELLVERGQQYKRAIQVFVRKVNRYPATIEELESLNNTRFLRKRYIDPMTGKDKWRLIHINGGVLTDSIIQKTKPGQGDQQQTNNNTFIGEGPVMGAGNDPSQQQVNQAMRRRASDDRPAVTQEAPESPAQTDTDDNSGDNADNSDNDNSNNNNQAAPITPGGNANNQLAPGQPGARLPGTFNGAYPGQPGFNPNAPNMPFGAQNGQNQANNGAVNTGQAGTQDASSGSSVYVAPSLGSSPTTTTANPLQGQAGMPGQPGFPGRPGMMPGQPNGFGGQAGGFGNQQQSAFGAQQGFNNQSGFNQMNTYNGNSPGANTNNAPNMQTLGLTGPSAIQQPGMAGMGGTQVGGGIAGVASEYKGPTIKIYNERKKYNEWEFVYDQSKDRGLAGLQMNGGAPGTPASQMGSMPGQQPGANGMNGNNGFGSSGNSGSAFSGNSGFSSGANGQGTVSGGIFGAQGSGFGQQQPQPQPPQQQPPN